MSEFRINEGNNTILLKLIRDALFVFLYMWDLSIVAVYCGLVFDQPIYSQNHIKLVMGV